MPWNDFRYDLLMDVNEVLRQEFRAAPTQPVPDFPDEEPDSGVTDWPPTPPIAPEMNTIAASYDDLLRTIEELKGGRPPMDDFEHQLCAAIQRNKMREAEQTAAEEAGRPSRFDRILGRVR